MQNITLHEVTEIAISPITVDFPYFWREFKFTNSAGNETRVIAHTSGTGGKENLALDSTISQGSAELIKNMLERSLSRLVRRGRPDNRINAAERALAEFKILIADR